MGQILDDSEEVWLAVVVRRVMSGATAVVRFSDLYSNLKERIHLGGYLKLMLGMRFDSLKLESNHCIVVPFH